MKRSNSLKSWFLVAICLISSILNAQTKSEAHFIDTVKQNLFAYLNSQNILENLNTVEENDKRTFSYELFKKTIISADSFGIFGFGVHTSGTKTYVVIIENLTFKIFDPDDLSTTILLCIEALRRENTSEEIILKYIESLLEIYKKNQNLGNGVLSPH